MREAHRAPHTMSLGLGDLATYNLASISTLARAVMIWKDQDGYGLGGWLRPRPPVHWAGQDPRASSRPGTLRAEPGMSGGRDWSGSGTVKSFPAGSPLGSVERGPRYPRPGPAGLQECVLWGRRAGEGGVGK